MIPLLNTEQKPDTRTPEEKMREVNAILKMTAERLGCKMSDLQWKRDKGGHIHIRRCKHGETNKEKSQEDS